MTDPAKVVALHTEGAPIHEDAKHPCNICGRGWPYHETVCAYAGTVRDLQAAQADRDHYKALAVQYHAALRRIALAPTYFDYADQQAIASAKVVEWAQEAIL